MTYSLTITTAPRSAPFRIAGDLDYETTDELVEAASQVLARRNDLSDLHLDFSETTFLDSAALSGIASPSSPHLASRRRTSPRPSPDVPRPHSAGHRTLQSLRPDSDRGGDRRPNLLGQAAPASQALAEPIAPAPVPGRSRNVTDALSNC